MRTDPAKSQVLLINHPYTHSHVCSASNAAPDSSSVALTDEAFPAKITHHTW